MATIVALKSGNWSDPTVWPGGMYPTVGDTVQPGAYAVTIDQDVDLGGGTLQVTGAGYFQVSAAPRSIVANIAGPGSSSQGSALKCSHNSGIVSITGNITGIGGANNNSILCINGVGQTNITGNIYGGANSMVYGTQIQQAATVNITGIVSGGPPASSDRNYGISISSSNAQVSVTGAVQGNSGSSSCGICMQGSNNTLNIYGDSTGGSGGSAHGIYVTNAGVITVAGSAIGGNGGYGVCVDTSAAVTVSARCAIGNNFGPGGSDASPHTGIYGKNGSGSVVKVKKIVSGPYGQCGVAGAVLLDTSDPPANQSVYRTGPNGATVTLADPAVTQDPPAVTDVRQGVPYLNGNRVGSCAVPQPGSVALGAPVDATVGTAVLTRETLLEAIGTAEGDHVVTVTTVDDDGAPLSGVLVTAVMSGEIKAQKRTALGGVATLLLPTGEASVSASGVPGYNGASVTVQVDGDLAQTLTLTRIQVDAPANPRLCTVYGDYYRNGTALSGVTVTAVLKDAALGDNGVLLDCGADPVQTDANGRFSWQLVRGKKYRITFPAHPARDVDVPDAGSYNVGAIYA